MRWTSVSWTSVDLPNLRFRPRDFLVRMWRAYALWRLIFPVPVSLKRLAAERLVFIFGMSSPRSGSRAPVRGGGHRLALGDARGRGLGRGRRCGGGGPGPAPARPPPPCAARTSPRPAPPLWGRAVAVR